VIVVLTYVWIWAPIKPIKAMGVAAATTLPLVTVPIINQVELLFQDDLPEQLNSRVEMPCRDVWVLPQQPGRFGHARMLVQNLPLPVLGHVLVQALPVQLGRALGYERGRHAKKVGERLALEAESVSKRPGALYQTGKTRDTVQDSLGLRLLRVSQCPLEILLGERRAVVLADVELAVAAGLLVHQCVQSNESEAVVPSKPAILPLHCVLDVILVGYVALPGLDKICNTSAKQSRAGQGKQGIFLVEFIQRRATDRWHLQLVCG
jgi:hypothetical protein